MKNGLYYITGWFAGIGFLELGYVKEWWEIPSIGFAIIHLCMAFLCFSFANILRPRKGE